MLLSTHVTSVLFLVICPNYRLLLELLALTQVTCSFALLGYIQTYFECSYKVESVQRWIRWVLFSSFTQLNYRSYECWIEGKWTFSDPWEAPWNFPQPSVEPPEPLSCFSITEIVHGTHAIERINILETGFEAHQLKIEPQGNKFTWSGERKDLPRQLCQTLCLPGYYVWFAPEVTLTKAQRATCWKMIRENGVTQFADYIEDHSRYGSQAFSLSLSDAVQLYKYSLEKYCEKIGRPTLDIVFKRAGTKRYQRYVGYILVISAKINGHDCLPNFANISPENDPSSDTSPITVLSNSELRFRPKGIATEQGYNWCSWDQVEIAFHFPFFSKYPNTNDPPPVLFTRRINPYDDDDDLFCSAQCIDIQLTEQHVGQILQYEIRHTFCVHSKYCIEKTEESASERKERQERKFRWS